MRSPFEILESYERRSLTHAVLLPVRQLEEGAWRGVGYRVGNNRLVSEFREVVEIVPLPPVTPVPGAKPWLLGVSSLRGNLFPVIDLKLLLEGKASAPSLGVRRALIVQQQDGDVALTIDELYGQRSFTDAQEVKVGGALTQGKYSQFVTRAFHSEGYDWGVFSLAQLIHTPEFQHAAA